MHDVGSLLGINLIVWFGIAFLLFAWWDYSRDTADASFLLDWMWWWEFDRTENPGIFWLITVVQFGTGIAAVLYGGYLTLRAHGGAG